MGELESIPAATGQEMRLAPDEPLAHCRANIYSKRPFTPSSTSKVNLESLVRMDTGRKCKLHTGEAPGPRRIWTRNLFCNCANYWAILRSVHANERSTNWHPYFEARGEMHCGITSCPKSTPIASGNLERTRRVPNFGMGRPLGLQLMTCLMSAKYARKVAKRWHICVQMLIYQVYWLSSSWGW